MPTAHIPARQKKLVIITSIVFLSILIIGAVTVNLLTGSPLDWFWLIGGSLFTTGLWLLFLWVRLSD